MKILVVSDIHGNHSALAAVLDSVAHDVLVCCGDLVVDYPFPEECVALIRDKASYVCCGNNDHAVAFGEKPSEHVSARWRHYASALDKATELTAALMIPGAKRYLKELPRECRFTLDDIRFYVNHTVPDMPLNYYLDMDSAATELERCYRDVPADIILTGHTHVPYLKRVGNRIVLNPGSIGEPRDRDPRASFAIIDTHTGCIQLGRLAYDITEIAIATKASGFPGYSLFCLRNGYLPDDPDEA
jgi:putative phosphoesterase